MISKHRESHIGVGATNELSLRVSVAALVRMLFEHPRNGELMLALERRATLLSAPAAVPGGIPGKHFIDINAQPFGGALRLLDPTALRDLVGSFHFDCEASHSEQDFRIFIRPSAWESVREFCLHHLYQPGNPVLESDPRRELAEELTEALKINLKSNQFTYKPVGTIIEDVPSPTENFYTRGSLTARVYRIFESHIVDPSLVHAMLANSKSCSNQDLQKLAFEDIQHGGPGWANAILTLPLKQINALYFATDSEARNRPISFQNHRLDETVAAVLENAHVPKYRRV